MDQSQKRLQLHQQLIEVSGLNPKSIYFQPPPDKVLNYPCIIYELVGYRPQRANNDIYLQRRRYKIVLLDANPDNLILDRLLEMPLTSFSTSFVQNNLNHYNLETYF